jgi:iron complex transport system substrate-binding protein
MLHRAAAVLVGVLLIGACGGADDGGASAATVPTGADSAFPVTIEHRYGTTTVAAAPERIVAVGLTEQDALLALGIAPVATTEWFGEHPGAIWPWATDELEALGADYERLTAIAPTVAQPAEHGDFGVPWQDMTRTVGRAVGLADEADDLVERVEAEITAAREAHPEFDGASAVMATPYEGIYVYGPQDARGRFLTDLGFDLPPGLAEVTGEEYGGNLSPERVDMLDVDVIVWLDALGEAAEPVPGREVYEALPVHIEGREVFLDSFDDPLGGATSFVTVLSVPFLLEGLVPKLAAAADGDPATAVQA